MSAMHGTVVFQSAPPVKGATIYGSISKVAKLFQSAPPVKGATHPRTPARRRTGVSIRAPREGGDWGVLDRVPMS